MAEQEQGKIKPAVHAGHPPHGETLPYAIEVWDAKTGTTVERVLARALNATLARAIFKSACAEYPGRRVTLRSGTEILYERS